MQAFRSVGYEHLALIDRDHTPPWTTANVPVGANYSSSGEPAAPRERARSSRPRGQHALRALFRDYLRAHPRAAAAYADLKRKLAALDLPLPIGDYTDLKDPACDLVVAAADDWATQTGWEAGQSDA